MNRREQVAYWGGAVLVALFSSAIIVNTTFLQPEIARDGSGVIISAREHGGHTAQLPPRALPMAATQVRVRIAQPRHANKQAKRTASIGHAPRSSASSGLILQVQRKLARMGYDPGPVDGRLGPATRAAIRKFQKANNMPPTGEIEPGVMALLLP